VDRTSAYSRHGLGKTYRQPVVHLQRTHKNAGRPGLQEQNAANFYLLYNIKVDAAVAWYSSHLSGFKKVSGYESQRSQVPFYKPDGTIVIIVTGDPGEGENTDAYSVAYERYQPGISERTITSLTQGKIVCQ
jgi:hypothetical protein